MSNNPKHRLPQVLLSIKQKLNALLIQHLVLNDDDSDRNSDVVEYDHQCEGLEIIVDFVKTKQQNLLLKAYSTLQRHQPQQNRPTPKKAANTTTRRTYLNTTLSDASPIQQVYKHVIPSLKGDSSRIDLNGSRQRGTVDMKQLLDRVKTARSNQAGNYSFHQAANYSYIHDLRQNASYCDHCYQPSPRAHYQAYAPQQRFKTNPILRFEEECRSQQLSKKTSRRQFILNKFNRIENTLNVMESRSSRPGLNHEIMGEIYSIKQRLRL